MTRCGTRQLVGVTFPLSESNFCRIRWKYVPTRSDGTFKVTFSSKLQFACIKQRALWVLLMSTWNLVEELLTRQLPTLRKQIQESAGPTFFMEIDLWEKVLITISLRLWNLWQKVSLCALSGLSGPASTCVIIEDLPHSMGFFILRHRARRSACTFCKVLRAQARVQQLCELILGPTGGQYHKILDHTQRDTQVNESVYLMTSMAGYLSTFCYEYATDSLSRSMCAEALSGSTRKRSSSLPTGHLLSGMILRRSISPLCWTVCTSSNVTASDLLISSTRDSSPSGSESPAAVAASPEMPRIPGA